MTTKNLTREHYDRTPYPPPGRPRWKVWQLPPLDWMLSIDRQRPLHPKRVLVAGCGSGNEAFVLQRTLKGASIMAIDFSARSIREARKTQSKFSSLKRIRFLEADLSDRDLWKKTGVGFDFIVCHGVLSYIPRPELALSNLARCLAPDGVLCLGVNGASHFSANLRPVLRKLGCDTTTLPHEDQWRCLLKMWENAEAPTKRGAVTRLPHWYFGSDLFGPVIHNYSLSQWIEIFRRAGLFLRASVGALRPLRTIVDSEAAPLFISSSRAEICEALDLMNHAGFHRLILTRQPVADPPWKDWGELLSWRPAHTGLYKLSFPRRIHRTGSDTVAVLKSRSLETRFDWPMPQWEAEMLRRCDGATPIGRLLRDAGRRAPTAQLAEHLFLLYQFAVLNLFAP